MTQQSTLLDRFARCDAHVAIIGLGYVGLPLAVAFAEAGYRVTGIDLDMRKVDAINHGESYIEDVPTAKVAALVRGIEEEKRLWGEDAAQPLLPITPPYDPMTQHLACLSATTDFGVLASCDAVSICVPTPLNKTGDPDVSYIASAAEQIARYLHPGMVIVLESTTYPGTTREMLFTQLASNVQGWQVGEDFFLAFSPERVDLGRTDWTTHNTPKVDRRGDDGVLGRGDGLLRRCYRATGGGLLTRSCRDDQALREHLPLSQHWAGQRTAADV